MYLVLGQPRLNFLLTNDSLLTHFLQKFDDNVFTWKIYGNSTIFIILRDSRAILLSYLHFYGIDRKWQINQSYVKWFIGMSKSRKVKDERCVLINSDYIPRSCTVPLWFVAFTRWVEIETFFWDTQYNNGEEYWKLICLNI